MKALYRRGQARVALHKLGEARDGKSPNFRLRANAHHSPGSLDLFAAAKIEPQNAIVRTELTNVQGLLDDLKEQGLPEMLKTRISRLKTRLNDFEAAPRPQAQDVNADDKSESEESVDEDEEESDRLETLQKAHRRKFLKIIQDTCVLVREAETWRSPDLPVVVDAAHRILNQAASFSYDGPPQLFEYLPSVAHDPERDSPLITDHKEVDVPIRT